MDYPQNNGSSQLDMYVDNEMARHLGDTAKWGKFLAISGLIMSGLLLIAFLAGWFEPNSDRDDVLMYSDPEAASIKTGTMIVATVVMLLLAVWPCILLLRTSIKLKSALMASNQAELTQAFRLQKNLYMFMGIVTIIYLALVLLGVLAAIGNSN
jgi:magnesium-transporting ATPase (P-type)